MALKTLLPVLLTSLLLVGFRAPPEGSYQGVGSEAPDGGLVDLEGHARRLSEGAGGWTLLKFGTTWCPRCGEEVDELNKLAGDLQKMGVRVVEVFLRETGDVVRAHVKARPRAFRGLILVDAEGETIQAYGVSVIPRLFLVDPKGLVRLDSQFQDAGTLRQSLQRTLKAR